MPRVSGKPSVVSCLSVEITTDTKCVSTGTNRLYFDDPEDRRQVASRFLLLNPVPAALALAVMLSTWPIENASSL